MQIIIFVCTLLIIAFEIVSAFKMKRFFRNNEINKVWINPYKLRWLFGAPMAVASFFMTYKMTGEKETYKILGFPIMAAAFDEAGRDYISPLTGPIMFFNATVWYFLPWIFLFLWAIYLKRRL